MPIRIISLGALSYLTSYYFLKIISFFSTFLPVHPSFITITSMIVSAIVVSLSTYFMFDIPLSKLALTIKKVENGNFLVRAPVINRHEFGQLSSSFNNMLSHITSIAANQAQAEHELAATQEELKYKHQIAEQKMKVEETNQHLENAVKDLSLLYEIGQQINTIADFSVLYSGLSDTLYRYLMLSHLAILVYDDKQENLEVKATKGFLDEKMIKRATFKKGEGISGRALATAQRIYVKDTSNDKRFLHYKGADIPNPSSFLAVPLIYKNNTLGVINYARQGENKFSFADIKMLTMVANQVALTIANARLYTKTRQLSVTDELTGLYNRRFFTQSLHVEWKRAVRFKRPLSLIMIDIDNFKSYNDSFGHPQGDFALKEIARCMRDNLREVDLIAKFGGDEFIILLPDTDKHGAKAAAEKLRSLVEKLGLITKNNKQITISAGIANYPSDVENVDEMVDHADIALYKAKQKGRNSIELFKSKKTSKIEKEKQDIIETQEEEEKTVTTYLQ